MNKAQRVAGLKQRRRKKKLEERRKAGKAKVLGTQRV